MSDTEPDTDADTTLQDPDDYHRRQRLKEIHKARQRVHDALETDPDGHQSSKRQEIAQQYHRRDLAQTVAMYVAELEPLLDATDADTTLPDRYPWHNALQFADALGAIPRDADVPDAYSGYSYAPRPAAIQVYRICNRVLADVKPLIEEDDTDEWEV